LPFELEFELELLDTERGEEAEEAAGDAIGDAMGAAIGLLFFSNCKEDLFDAGGDIEGDKEMTGDLLGDRLLTGEASRTRVGMAPPCPSSFCSVRVLWWSCLLDSGAQVLLLGPFFS